MGTVDGKTGQVVGGDYLDDDYYRCILTLIVIDSPVGLHRSGGSHKHGVQSVRGAPNTMKLDIRGASGAIPVSILMPAMKAILCRLKIYQMVYMF